MEPLKRSPRAFVPSVMTELDSSWRRCYRKMKLGKIPLLSPQPTPTPLNEKLMGHCHDGLLCPSDSLKTEHRFAPLEQSDYFSTDPASGERTVSANPFAEYADVIKRPILTPTSNRSRCAFSEPDKAHQLTPPTTTRRARSFHKRCKSILPASRWPLLRPLAGVSCVENHVTPRCIHTQVDGMDDVAKACLPTPPASPASSSLNEESIQKDADGDLVLPDADAPQKSNRLPQRFRTSPHSSMSIDLTSPANSVFTAPEDPCLDVPIPMVPACPAKDPFQIPTRDSKKDSLHLLSLSRWAPSNKSAHRARLTSKKLDRFIPPRKSPRNSRESLRLGTATANLSNFEKTARQRHPASDPFSRKVPRSRMVQDSFRSLRVQGSTARGSSSPLDLNHPLALRHGPRQISDGAVWNVGGSAVVTDSVTGIPDGHGGMLSSGTNAPLHTSMFLTESDPISEQEAHENRLAYAMGIDQAQRVLGTFDDKAYGVPPTPGNKAWDVHEEKGPVWMDCQWTKPGSSISRFPFE